VVARCAALRVFLLSFRCLLTSSPHAKRA